MAYHYIQYLLSLFSLSLSSKKKAVAEIGLRFWIFWSSWSCHLSMQIIVPVQTHQVTTSFIVGQSLFSTISAKLLSFNWPFQIRKTLDTPSSMCSENTSKPALLELVSVSVKNVEAMFRVSASFCYCCINHSVHVNTMHFEAWIRLITDHY